MISVSIKVLGETLSLGRASLEIDFQEFQKHHSIIFAFVRIYFFILQFSIA